MLTPTLGKTTKSFPQEQRVQLLLGRGNRFDGLKGYGVLRASLTFADAELKQREVKKNEVIQEAAQQILAVLDRNNFFFRPDSCSKLLQITEALNVCDRREVCQIVARGSSCQKKLAYLCYVILPQESVIWQGSRFTGHSTDLLDAAFSSLSSLPFEYFQKLLATASVALACPNFEIHWDDLVRLGEELGQFLARLIGDNHSFQLGGDPEAQHRYQEGLIKDSFRYILFEDDQTLKRPDPQLARLALKIAGALPKIAQKWAYQVITEYRDGSPELSIFFPLEDLDRLYLPIPKQKVSKIEKEKKEVEDLLASEGNLKEKIAGLSVSSILNFVASTSDDLQRIQARDIAAVLDPKQKLVLFEVIRASSLILSSRAYQDVLSFVEVCFEEELERDRLKFWRGLLNRDHNQDALPNSLALNLSLRVLPSGWFRTSRKFHKEVISATFSKNYQRDPEALSYLAQSVPGSLAQAISENKKNFHTTCKDFLEVVAVLPRPYYHWIPAAVSAGLFGLPGEDCKINLKQLVFYLDKFDNQEVALELRKQLAEFIIESSDAAPWLAHLFACSQKSPFALDLLTEVLSTVDLNQPRSCPKDEIFRAYERVRPYYFEDASIASFDPTNPDFSCSIDILRSPDFCQRLIELLFSENVTARVNSASILELALADYQETLGYDICYYQVLDSYFDSMT